MIRINLLPVREKKKKESTRKMLSILILSAVVVLLIFVFVHLSLLGQVNQVEQQITAYKEEIRRLKIDTKDVDKFKAEKEDLQRRLNIIYTLQRAKTGPVRVLDDVATALPGKLWLTALKEKGGKMEIKGVAFDNQDIAAYMTQLEKSGVIRNVELVIAQQLEKKDVKLKEFTLTCQVNYASLPGGPTP
jgi:type IV pilus assembly protein PilN